MNLKEVRQWFIQDSGRYDLVVDAVDWADNGADKYIRLGQRLIDRLVEKQQDFARVFRTLAVGEWFVKFKNFRILKEVWAITTATRIPLDRLDYAVAKEDYGMAWGDITPGSAAYYVPAYLRLDKANLAGMDMPGKYADVSPEYGLYNGLIILPPTSVQLTIEVFGKFHSDLLSDDGDENYWTINEPGLLVMAGLRELEAFYRNTQGVRDWDTAIQRHLLELDKDFVENETGHITQLGG